MKLRFPSILLLLIVSIVMMFYLSPFNNLLSEEFVVGRNIMPELGNKYITRDNCKAEETYFWKFVQRGCK